MIAAGALILGFAMFGELVLRYLDVTIESLSIAGGLLLLLVALEMLRGTDFPTGDAEDVALVPLATPLVAGPGAIATAMVLWRDHPGGGGHAAVILGIVAAVACVGPRCSSPSGSRAPLPRDHLVPHTRLRAAALGDRRPARRERSSGPDLTPPEALPASPSRGTLS